MERPAVRGFTYLGRLNSSAGGAPAPYKHIQLKDYVGLEEYEETLTDMCKAYVHPAKGGAAERKSFNYQISQFISVPPPSGLEGISEEFFTNFFPKYPDITEGKSFQDKYQEAVQGLQKTSSPGALFLSFTDNGAALTMRTDEVAVAVGQLYHKLVTNDYTGYSSLELFKEFGLAYRVFIKSELHPIEKAESGRWRLIFSNPLILNLVERIIYADLFEVEKADCLRYPPKIGLVMSGPDKVQHSARLCDAVRRQLGEHLATTDAKGWDWSVNSWLYKAQAEAYAQTQAPEIARAIRNLAHMVMNKTIMFSDGLLYTQDEEGIQASGSYPTSQANSRMRALARYLIDRTRCITMGDDCIESFKLGLVESYAKLGLRLKPYHACTPDNFEFCSKHFTPTSLVATDHSATKMLLKAYLTNDPVILNALHQELEGYDSPLVDILCREKVGAC